MKSTSKKSRGLVSVLAVLATVLPGCIAADVETAPADEPALEDETPCDAGAPAPPPEDAPSGACASDRDCPELPPVCVDGLVVERYAGECREGACWAVATCGPSTPRRTGSPYPACWTGVGACAK